MWHGTCFGYRNGIFLVGPWFITLFIHILIPSFLQPCLLLLRMFVTWLVVCGTLIQRQSECDPDCMALTVLWMRWTKRADNSRAHPFCSVAAECPGFGDSSFWDSQLDYPWPCTSSCTPLHPNVLICNVESVKQASLTGSFVNTKGVHSYKAFAKGLYKCKTHTQKYQISNCDQGCGGKGNGGVKEWKNE